MEIKWRKLNNKKVKIKAKVKTEAQARKLIE